MRPALGVQPGDVMARSAGKLTPRGENPGLDLRAYYEDGGRRFRHVPEFDPIELVRVRLGFRLIPPGVGPAVLDVGCGDGYLCEQLARRAFRSVVGLDLAASRIAYARARYRTLDLTQADVCRLPFKNGQFDLVTCVEVLEHLPEPETALREMARVSRRYVICTTPYREGVQESLCPHCGRSFPPAGHLQSFDERRFESMGGDAGLRLVKWAHSHPMLEYRRFRYCPPLRWLIQGYYRESGFIGGLFEKTFTGVVRQCGHW